MSEVISLDEHRLLCGNAQVKEDVDKLLGGVKVDLLLTDPPYGIDIVNPVGGGQNGGQGASSIRPIKHTHTHTPNGTIGGAKPPTFKRNSGNTSKTRLPQERERERANGKVGKPRRCSTKTLQTSNR